FPGKVMFIDWNSSEYKPTMPQTGWDHRVWQDLRYFFASVLYPMFAHRMLSDELSGLPIGPNLEGFPTGDRGRGIFLEPGERLPLAGGDAELSDDIKHLVTAGFRRYAQKAFQDAAEAAAAFRAAGEQLRDDSSHQLLEDLLRDLAGVQA